MSTNETTRWRVLFVDDDPMMGMLARVALQRAGHHVTLATGHDAALEALQDPSAFHVVVCDLRLGSASGFDLARDILERRPGQRIMLVSGLVTEADRARAQGMGIVDIGPKHEVFADLAASLRRVLA